MYIYGTLTMQSSHHVTYIAPAKTQLIKLVV